MKHYELKVGEYNGFTQISIDIPEEIRFFYEEGQIGPILINDCEHYHTIVETKKYQSWIKSLSKHFGVWVEKIGEYSIISIYNLHKDTPIPTVDREEWIEGNNIDFSKYVIIERDDNFNILNTVRIQNFISPWDIDIIRVTRKYPYEDLGHFSIDITNVEIGTIQCIHKPHRFKIVEGVEAQMLWNNMVYQVIKRVDCDTFYFDDNYDFDKEKNKWKHY